MRLANYIYSRTNIPTWLPYKDAQAAACLGQVIAGERFDPGRGCSFSSFAWNYIRGEIFNEADRWRWFKHAPVIDSLHAPCEDDSSETVLDRLHAKQDSVEDVVAQRELLTLALQDVADKDIILKYFCEGYTLEEIGQLYGISRYAVRDRIDKALSVMQRNLGLEQQKYKAQDQKMSEQTRRHVTRLARETDLSALAICKQAGCSRSVAARQIIREVRAQ